MKRFSVVTLTGLASVFVALCLGPYSDPFVFLFTPFRALAQDRAQGLVVIKGIVLNGTSVSLAPGEVIIRVGGRWSDATVGAALRAGDELKTGGASQVWVEFAGGGEGVIGSGSHFKVKGDRTLLGVVGEIWLRVRGRFRVETERMAAAVTGTEFGIELRGDGRMVLVVLDGAVRVEGASGSVEAKRSEAVEVDARGVVGRIQAASSGVLNRSWELAWDARRAVSGMVAEVAFVSGNASVERGGRRVPVELGMVLLKGDRLSTSENSRVELRSRDRAALDVRGGVERLDVEAVARSKDPIRKLWAETVWDKVQKVASGGAPSTTTVVGGIRGAEGDEEEDVEFLGGEEEERVVTPAEVETAIINLRKVVEDGGPQAEEALYLIAESYRYLSEVYYRRVMESFPNGKYTERARERVEKQ